MKIKKLTTVLLSLLIGLLLSNCSSGEKLFDYKLSYNQIKTEIPIHNSFTYSIATYDQRLAVVDGSRNEEFVGYVRSQAWIAYPIDTKSGENFSDEFSLVIKNSMYDSSNQTQIIQTNFSDSKQNILNRLVDSNSDRLLLFTITKWETDSKPPAPGKLVWMPNTRTSVLWDILLEIYTKDGELIAFNKTDGLDRDVDDNKKGHKTEIIQLVVNEKFKEKIDILFDDAEIQKALTIN